MRMYICFDKIGLCAQNIDNILASVISTVKMVHVIIWTEMECSVCPLVTFVVCGKISEFFLQKFIVSTMILNLEVTIFVIVFTR